MYCPFSATQTFSEHLPCVEKVQQTGNNTKFGLLLPLGLNPNFAFPRYVA